MNDLTEQEMLEQFLDRVVVVLMRTTHPGNIGAVARACKNMGFKNLRLVEPVEFPSHEATRRASGADDLLENAQVFKALDDAIADCHQVVGASARSRSMVWPVSNPRECAQSLYQQVQSLSPAQDFKIALLFGQEASGLTNEELQRCNLHVNIPANPEYSSLNLAMAVQVVCYEMRMVALYASQADSPHLVAVQGAGDAGWDVEPANHAELSGMLEHFEQALVHIDYHDPSNPRVLMTRLRRLFQRSRMDKMEVNIFRGISKKILAYRD